MMMPTALDNDVLVLISDAARHMRTYVDRAGQALGMTRAQMIILGRLERQPDITQNELAAIAEVTPMTIARLIDRLEERGLVERCPDPQDRRIWRLRLTPEAAPVLSEIGQLRARLHSDMTGGIDPRVLDAMVVGLREIKKNITNQRVAETAV
jgi:MarR family transcriptional regulator, transcriptional regulator for hemolysin